MIECLTGRRKFLYIFICSLLINFVESIRCFYCASPGTKIAPQLWLHTEPCTNRRHAICNSPEQSCVVVKVSHTRLNFTVSGCSEDQFEGCDQFVQLAHHGPTSVHMCQCRKDRCNNDFHLDFGVSLGRIRNEKARDTEAAGKLPLLKKVHPIDPSKNGGNLPCADEQCNTNLSSNKNTLTILTLLFLVIQHLWPLKFVI